jgi:hypothetical protein
MKKFSSTLLLLLTLYGGSLLAQASGQYYLIFSARGASLHPFSLAGHAFVSWGRQLPNDTVVEAPLTLGLYPKKGATLIDVVATEVPGRVVGGFVANSRRQRTSQVVFRVDSLSWSAARDTALAWQGRKYNLLGRNCVSFMDAVADAAHLQTPSTRTIFRTPRQPGKYLRRLWRRNTTRIVPAPHVRYDHSYTAPEVLSLQ